MLDIMMERTKIMDNMTKNVAAFTQVANKETEETADSLWGKTLVLMMARMDQEIKDKFMVFVYKTAIEAIHGKVPDI
jgi:uncharacterized protein YbcI